MSSKHVGQRRRSSEMKRARFSSSQDSESRFRTLSLCLRIKPQPSENSTADSPPILQSKISWTRLVIVWTKQLSRVSWNKCLQSMPSSWLQAIVMVWDISRNVLRWSIRLLKFLLDLQVEEWEGNFTFLGTAIVQSINYGKGLEWLVCLREAEVSRKVVLEVVEYRERAWDFHW